MGPPSEGERLDREQIALVLRRATELDGQLGPDPSGLDLSSLEEAAVEAGLTRESVRRAVAELKAGALAPGRPGGATPAGLGPAVLTVSRSMPGPAPVVDAILRRFLAKEQFRIRRDFGQASSWDRRRDVPARVRVSLDRGVSHRFVLRQVRHVEIAVVEEPGSAGGRVMVKLAVDVAPLRRSHRVAVAQGAGLGLTATAAAVGLAGIGMPEALVALPAITGSGAAAGHLLGRSKFRSGVSDLETALEGFLDGVERRPSAEGRGPGPGR